MKKTLLANSNDSFQVSQTAINELGLLIDYSYVTANEGTTTNIDLSKIQVSLVINQGGKAIRSNINLAPLFALACSKTAVTQYAGTSNSVLSTSNSIGLPIEVGTNTRRLVRIPILVHDYDLKGNDSITLEVNQFDFDGANVTSSTVYAYIKETTDVKQNAIYVPRTYNLNTTSLDYTLDIPFCSDINLVYADSDVYSTFSLTNLSMKSKFLSFDMDSLQLIGQQQDVQSTAFGVLPIFKADDMVQLHGARLYATLSTAENIIAKNDAIVYYEVVPSASVMRNFTKKIDKYNVSKAEVFTEVHEDCNCKF